MRADPTSSYSADKADERTTRRARVCCQGGRVLNWLHGWLRRGPEPVLTEEEAAYLAWLRLELDAYTELAGLRDAWRRGVGAAGEGARRALARRVGPALAACRRQAPPARFAALHAALSETLAALAALAEAADAEVAALDRRALASARHLARLAARSQRRRYFTLRR